jgi:acetylornithine deacetylase/succinyl-diaminopimelate desuccinylase family protein
MKFPDPISAAQGSSPVLALLADLVRINSVNPAYEGGQSEAGVVSYLEEYFRRNSIETWQQEALPGRLNLIARLPGRDNSRRLIFEAHADTVYAGGMEIAPFEPLISEGRLYGRGSCDTKAGLAAMAYAAVSLKRDGVLPGCEVWVVAAADEEHSFHGVRRLLQGLEATAAVVSEPTQMNVAAASKGVLRWRIECRGKAAHSAKPHLGVNAIANMARVILALEKDNERLQATSHPLLGAATLNVGIIQGGRQVNVVPDLCAIDLDRRLLPGEAIRDVLKHYRDLLDPQLGAHFQPPMLEDEAFETPRDAAIVKYALRVSQDSGMNPESIGVPFGTDASKFSRAGIPSIICGPGSIDQAHGSIEYVECAQVEQAAEFYRKLMIAFAQ